MATLGSYNAIKAYASKPHIQYLVNGAGLNFQFANYTTNPSTMNAQAVIIAVKKGSILTLSYNTEGGMQDGRQCVAITFFSA